MTTPFGAQPREHAAEMHLLWSCLTIAAGGVLLSLQIDGHGALVGTGFASLGIGAVVALFATLLQVTRHDAMPRDGLGIFSAACGFLGLALVVSGVLAPGGSWMFFEVLLLLGLLARRRRNVHAVGPELSTAAVFGLSVMLLFRLWITYQGSQHRWAVMSLDVPILSGLPFEVFDPVKTVSLGSFEPHELGFPAAGLDFPLSVGLWCSGFALLVVGLWWRTRATFEHENDRIHATIQTLPPPLALLVEKILPEEEWHALGLHGLSERLRCKRIEALVRERMENRRDFEVSMRRSGILELPPGQAFTADIQGAFHADDARD